MPSMGKTLKLPYICIGVIECPVWAKYWKLPYICMPHVWTMCCFFPATTRSTNKCMLGQPTVIFRQMLRVNIVQWWIFETATWWSRLFMYCAMLIFRRCQACTLWTFCIAFRIISQWKLCEDAKIMERHHLSQVAVWQSNMAGWNIYISTLLHTFQINILTATGQSIKKRHRLDDLLSGT